MKTLATLKDLALFGAAPAFTDVKHVGRPNIGDRERLMERIHGILDRRWLTNDGPVVQAFENAIADHLGVRNCVAMSNGTIALKIAVRALGMQGEVIVPSFSFIATAHCLQWQQIKPVFCDIDPKTHNIDPARIEALITPATTGIIAVHLWGRPCAVEALADIAERHNLKLLYDASHAFSCTHDGQYIGNFGNAEVFSFHATKFINTFEGGAVVTNDDVLAERLRFKRNFGFAGYDHVAHVGINGKMHEVSAAMGLTSLESCTDFVATNRQNYERYAAHIAALPGLSIIEYPAQEHCNYQYIIVEVDPHSIALTRDQLLDILHAENVLARRYFWPGCHQMLPYADRTETPPFLPHTTALSERVLCLPTGTAISMNDIDAISRLLRFAIDHAAEIALAFPDTPCERTLAYSTVYKDHTTP